jgi:hypothetical protein
VNRIALMLGRVARRARGCLSSGGVSTNGCVRASFSSSSSSDTSWIVRGTSQSSTHLRCSPTIDKAAIVKSKAAIYEEYGAVDRVLQIQEVDLPAPKDLKPTEVLVRMLAAPVNPADFNMVEGVYSILQELPAVGGNEGVAEVLAFGADVKDYAVGDWVIPAEPGFGTWRTHAVCEASDLDFVANDIPPEYAASIAVNPCTAYRILRDFGMCACVCVCVCSRLHLAIVCF